MLRALVHRQKRSPYSLKSAQLTCRREHGVLIHYRPEHDNGHLFSEAAFRSCRLTGILARLLWLWHRLETNAGCWLAHNGNNNKNKKHSEIYIFSLKMVLHVSYSTYHPNAPNLLRRQAVYQPYQRWYHLACQGEWLNDCWVYGILPAGRWIH